MAYYLFNTIDEVKTFVGGAANKSLEMESIQVAMHAAAYNHIFPWLGEDQWDDLVAAVEAASFTTDQQNLLPFVQRPLALLTFHEYSKIGGIKFSEAGMFRQETETNKSAFKYQENAYRNWMLVQGYEAIEQMLVFLEKVPGTYALWETSSAYTMHRALYLRYARDMRKAHSQHVTRYTYEILRPIIESVEIFALLPLLGQAEFDSLKSDQYNPATLATRMKAIDLIRKAIAHFAIEEGVRQLWVQINGKNVVHVEQLEPQSYSKQGTGSTAAVDVKVRVEEEFANRHMSYLEKYLTDNIDDFPDYKAKVEAEATAAEEEAIDLCDERTNSDYSKKIKYPNRDNPLLDGTT